MLILNGKNNSNRDIFSRQFLLAKLSSALYLKKNSNVIHHYFLQISGLQWWKVLLWLSRKAEQQFRTQEGSRLLKHKSINTEQQDQRLQSQTVRPNSWWRGHVRTITKLQAKVFLNKSASSALKQLWFQLSRRKFLVFNRGIAEPASSPSVMGSTLCVFSVGSLCICFFYLQICIAILSSDEKRQMVVCIINQ